MNTTKEIVKIYVLVDPITLKVRYIGRTIASLNMRISQHVFKAKNNKLKTYRDNWIQSLLKLNARPIIKQLTTVVGWKESHLVERALITKHMEKHDLTNHYDKGEGNKSHRVSDDARSKISETLKSKYNSGELTNPADLPCYVYDLNGEFISEYSNAKKAADALSIYVGSVKKCLQGKHQQIRGYQFSRTLNQMPILESKKAIINGVDLITPSGEILHFSKLRDLKAYLGSKSATSSVKAFAKVMLIRYPTYLIQFND